MALKRLMSKKGIVAINPQQVTSVFPPGNGAGLIDEYCIVRIGSQYFDILGTVDSVMEQLQTESLEKETKVAQE